MTANLTPEQMAEFRQHAREGNREIQCKLGILLKHRPSLGEPGEFKHWLTLAAENGDASACWELAEVYLTGGLIEQDYGEAHRWLNKGVELNHAVCLYNLGVQYFQGAGVEEDRVKAFDLFRRSAGLGDTNALYNLALCYAKGVGVTADLDAAYNCAKTLSATGDKRSLLLMALIAGQANEVGEPPDEPPPQPDPPVSSASVERELSAEDKLKLAAEGGAADAQCSYAKLLYERGKLDDALRWFEKAAESGHAEAQYQLANCYLKDRGAVGDMSKARVWLEKAAARQHFAARQRLEWVKARQAQAEAAALRTKRAADAGNANAQYDLARQYLTGAFAPPDIPAAAHYFEMAARQNHPDAQFALFTLHDQGLGVDKSKEKSVPWLIQAAASGQREAMFFLVRRYADRRISEADYPGSREVFLKCRYIYPDYPDPESPGPTFEQLQAAAGEGDLPSMYLLAQQYADTESPHYKPQGAVELLREAADQEYAPALFELARRYGLGEDVPRDLKLGKEFCIRALRQKHAEAHFMLKSLYQATDDELERILKNKQAV